MANPTDRTLLILLLVLLGIVLMVTIVPGVFIIDEDNYLVTVVGLRHGQLSVPGTENLTPSREIAYYDPEASRRVIQSTPVVSLVPPLYAFLALPFSYGGWRGLVFLNILSFLVAIYLVFRYVQQLSQQRSVPWIASTLFALGGYCIEYAQGVWPEMLSVALCLGTVVLCFQARRNGSAVNAFFAGVLIGLATGVREQNIFFAGCVGLGMLLFGARRYRSVIAYALGVILLLIVIATVNDYRFGIWHPFPKVTSYTQEVASTTGGISLLEPLKVFWSKVVDYPSYGSNTAHIRNGYYQWDETSGTVLMNGIVKKSWIQSSPWIGLAIIALIVSWFVRRVKSSDGTQEIQVIGLIVVPTLLMFSAAGFDRTDGLSFNQRYFLELLPLCAIALGLYLDRVKIDLVPVGIGFAVGGIIVAATLLLPSSTLRHVGQRYLPLLLALVLITAWYLLKNPRAIFLLLGMCIGWAFFFHIESDLVGSRFRRQINAARFDYLQKIVPDHSALFTYWGNKDAVGPIQLEKDVVILDVWADEGHDARLLEEELLTQGRRIFILENDMPGEILRGLIADRIFHEYSEGNIKLAEILVAKAPAGSR
jgi:hypothetical protein